jgi:hypothetical protein
MTTTHIHAHSPAANEAGFISFADWVNTLPDSQRVAATAGRENQTAITNKHLASGKIISQVGEQIVWATGSTAEQNEVDPTFFEYFTRYVTESGTTHSVTVS